ncbi:MAG: GxxExxY protein [Limisphaerales bacterium]
MTGEVSGAAIAVHRSLGPGVAEAACEAALSRKLGRLGVAHECQRVMPIGYKGVLLDCGFRLDVVVENRLPLGLKAVEVLLPIHHAQLLTYLRLGGFPLGLLLNFEVALLKDGVHRLVQTQHRPPLATAPAEPSSRFDSLSREIVNAAVAVHGELGPGLLRSAYEECLCHELNLRQIRFARRHSLPLVFEGEALPAAAELPLLVEARVPVFTLAVTSLTALHEATLLARLRQGKFPYGLLLNFNSESLARSMRRLTL